MTRDRPHEFLNLLQRCRHKATAAVARRGRALDDVSAILLSDLIVELSPRRNICQLQISALLREVVSEYVAMNLGLIKLSLKIVEDVTVTIDSGQVREAFRNIIDNAIEAMPEGGRLTITAGPTEDRENAIIIFEDTGVGMTEREKHRATAGTSLKKGRRGVGVIIATALVGVHNGSIHIRTAKNIGTQVTVMLPLLLREESR